MKKFLDTGQLTQEQFAYVKAQIGSKSPSQSKVDGKNSFDAKTLSEKLIQMKDLYEKDLISRKQYEKLRNKILGLN